MRQNLNRVDHVIICVQPENLAAAATTYADLLDITFEGPFELAGHGLTIYVDWDSGIEIMAPTRPEIAQSQARFLAEHGEGVFRICFGFADRDIALARAEAMGIAVTSRFDFTDFLPQWSSRFSASLESHLEPVHGVRFNFSEIERVDVHSA